MNRDQNSPVGIDRISFYVPPYYLPLKELAEAREVPVEKYTIGIGQEKMAIALPDEDIVTMAIKAIDPIIDDISPEKLDYILFATETSVDHAKAAATYILDHFKWPRHVKLLEMKQACYASTGALQLALSHIRCNPDSQILVIASDISKYELGNPAEATQGCGAVAMLLKSNPRIAKIKSETGFWSEPINDFWRPLYSQVSFVDGPVSAKNYLMVLEKSWAHLREKLNIHLQDFGRICCHLPCTRLAVKAYMRLAKLCGQIVSEENAQKAMDHAISYGRVIGNCYTASLYISLISLLETDEEDLSGKLVGCYAYGSGSTGEFFLCEPTMGYKEHLHSYCHQSMLSSREAISFKKYEEYHELSPKDFLTQEPANNLIRFSGYQEHIRQYQILKAS